jgi:Spy/CpxP family protein refolding chaperone
MLVIGLAISLLFNLAVLIGFVQKRVASRSPGHQGAPPTTQPTLGALDDEAQKRRVARELGLDDSQVAAFAELQRRQRQLSSLFADSAAVIRQDLATELAREEPDLDRVRALVDQEAELGRQRRRSGADLYGEFVAVLTPQQRQRLGARFAPPPAPGQPSQQPGRSQGRSQPPQQKQRGAISPELIARFDRNNNGRLEVDEMQAARRELDVRRREVAPHLPKRPPLWPWFDADDDGLLNEAERGKMEVFMRENNISPEEAGPIGAQVRPGRRGGEAAPGRSGGPRGDRRPDPAEADDAES